MQSVHIHIAVLGSRHGVGLYDVAAISLGTGVLAIFLPMVSNHYVPMLDLIPEPQHKIAHS